MAGEERLRGLDPAHALYVYVQNQISVLSEELTGLPEMAPFVRMIAPAEDDYMPSGPPMSPLTASYFTSWAFFDAAVGAERETIGTCIASVVAELGAHPEFVRLVLAMQPLEWASSPTKGWRAVWFVFGNLRRVRSIPASSRAA